MKIENWNGHQIRFIEIKGEWFAVLKDVEIVPYDGPDFNRQYIEALERVEKIKNLDWSAENEDRHPA